MFTILWWLWATMFESLWNSFWKKSLDMGKLSNVIFKLYSHIFWMLAIPLIMLFFWFDNMMLENNFDLVLMFFMCLIWSLNILLWLKVYKTTKLSELLPYSNLDKMFMMMFGFFIFYWTNNWSSVYTLLISLITLMIMMLFTVDIKKFKISKNMLFYLIHKVFIATNVLLTWYLLTKYSSFTMATMTWFFEFMMFIMMWFIIKTSFKSMMTQNKNFYMYSLLTAMFWWSWWLMWLMLLKEAWVVIATLLWFLWIVFNVISMKFMLNDTPTKKQMTLAMLVLMLMSMWFYFKDL